MKLKIANWIADSLGEASRKFFKEFNDGESAVKNAKARYIDEKYKYHEMQEKVFPKILDLGEMKLDAWSGYQRMDKIIGLIKNRPIRLTYYNYTNITITEHDIYRLKSVSALLLKLKSKDLFRSGTGILTSMAIHGGTLMQRMDKETADVVGSDEEEEGQTLLEAMANKTIKSDYIEKIDEIAVMNALLATPQNNEEFEECINAKDLSGISKEEAMKFKDSLDEKSLLLADATARLKRISEYVSEIYLKMEKLRAEQVRQIEYLEEYLKKEREYNKFDLEAKLAFAYAAQLGKTARNLSRTDIVSKLGNQVVLNNANIRKAVDAGKTLLATAEKAKY